MQATVLFDNKAVSPDLKTGFGLSLLIGKTVIFDAGSDGHAVIHNIKTLDIDTSRIKTIVVSHEHWDHTDGLPDVLSVCNKPDVYICPGSPDTIRQKIAACGVKVITKYIPDVIAENIYTTGEIACVYKDEPLFEQSIIIADNEGHTSLICGCAHYGLLQGITRIKGRIARYLPGKNIEIKTIIGGFHLAHETSATVNSIAMDLYESGIRTVAPLHCSGESNDRIFSCAYNEGYHALKVGSTIEL